MAETTQFELVSPEKLLYSEAAEMVVVPGTEGYFGVLPRHAPMISTLEPGVIDIHQNGSVAERIFVAGGFAEGCEDGSRPRADRAADHGSGSSPRCGRLTFALTGLKTLKRPALASAVLLFAVPAGLFPA